jgi:hypothetical protein
VRSEATLTELEVGTLARELAQAYDHMARYYHEQYELSVDDADRRARGLDSSPTERAADVDRIAARPADQVSWWDLTRLAERDPAAMAAVWTRLKAAAQDDLVSGHRTARALEWQGRPWQRAQYLAIRDGFHASWPPQNGIEAALLDTAAHCFADYLQWSERLHLQAGTDAKDEEDRLKRDGYWLPPRVSIAEAIEHSATMAERAHTRFLRTLKSLHELRRLTPAVFVGTAEQVNVGMQQVNLGRQSPVPEPGEEAVPVTERPRTAQSGL